MRHTASLPLRNRFLQRLKGTSSDVAETEASQDPRWHHTGEFFFQLPKDRAQYTLTYL